MNLETYANNVAERVAGPQPASDMEAGMDWTSLADLIEQIILLLADNCPANNARVVQAAMNPNRRQKNRFRAKVSRECKCCQTVRWRNESGVIAEEMMAAMGELSESEVLGIVFEARNEDWILV